MHYNNPFKVYIFKIPMGNISTNWLVLYDVLFYAGFLMCIIGFMIWWVLVSGFAIMFVARWEEMRIKKINNLEI